MRAWFLLAVVAVLSVPVNAVLPQPAWDDLRNGTAEAAADTAKAVQNVEAGPLQNTARQMEKEVSGWFQSGMRLALTIAVILYVLLQDKFWTAGQDAFFDIPGAVVLFGATSVIFGGLDALGEALVTSVREGVQSTVSEGQVVEAFLRMMGPMNVGKILFAFAGLIGTTIALGLLWAAFFLSLFAKTLFILGLLLSLFPFQGTKAAGNTALVYSFQAFFLKPLALGLLALYLLFVVQAVKEPGGALIGPFAYLAFVGLVLRLYFRATDHAAAPRIPFVTRVGGYVSSLAFVAVASHAARPVLGAFSPSQGVGKQTRRKRSTEHYHYHFHHDAGAPAGGTPGGQ